MGELDDGSLPPKSLDALPVRILTHNIRYYTKSPFEGEVPWPDRRPVFLSHLHQHTRVPFTPASTLICLQEVLHSQLQDILASLGPSWTYVGVGRDDGRTGGEYAPILFREAQWTLVRFETVWLSETPRQPGRRGWDAASVRILTCAVLVHVRTQRRVMVLNTHLDDQGSLSRQKGAEMIVRYARKWRRECRVDAWILAGDLNSEPDGKAYAVLNEAGSGFVDVRSLVEGDGEQERVKRYGDELTFTGFGADGERETRIDFVHMGIDDEDDEQVGPRLEKVKAKVHGYAVMPNRFDDGVYMSDHRAVIADLVL